jgi:TPR repeat protein
MGSIIRNRNHATSGILVNVRRQRSSCGIRARQLPAIRRRVSFVGLACLVALMLATPVGAASIWNVYFSNGSIPPGQKVRSESALPGPTKTFERGRDTGARLFVILGDFYAHSFQGELKAADGTTVRTLNWNIQSLTSTGQWRYASYRFGLQNLPPGEYKIDLMVDGAPKETYGFTLKNPRPAGVVPESSTAAVKDDAEAARSLHKAADGGDGHAMAKLGLMSFRGRGGLPKDDTEAVRWFRKGADVGDGLAMAFLGLSYWTGLGDLSKNEAEAVRWFRKGANAGDGRAMAMLGQAYWTGAGALARDEAEAVRWFRKGANTGDARAMAMLGEAYLTGRGALAQDDKAAVRWIRKAADSGDGFAMAMLGNLHETGEGGIAKDETQAVQWYRKGIEAGSGRAMAFLGSMYSAGRGGLVRDEAAAVRLYRDGASLLDAVAMFQLGQAYEVGRGVPKDRQEAARWYRRSVSFGSLDALDRLVALGEQP